MTVIYMIEIFPGMEMSGKINKRERNYWRIMLGISWLNKRTNVLVSVISDLIWTMIYLFYTGK